MTTGEKIDFVREHCQTLGDRLIIRRCSICEYPLGYFFSGDNLYFDSGCYCVSQPSGPQIREEQDLNQMFEMNPMYTPVLLDNSKREFIK